MSGLKITPFKLSDEEREYLLKAGGNNLAEGLRACMRSHGFNSPVLSFDYFGENNYLPRWARSHFEPSISNNNSIIEEYFGPNFKGPPSVKVDLKGDQYSTLLNSISELVSDFRQAHQEKLCPDCGQKMFSSLDDCPDELARMIQVFENYSKGGLPDNSQPVGDSIKWGSVELSQKLMTLLKQLFNGRNLSFESTVSRKEVGNCANPDHGRVTIMAKFSHGF